MKKTEHITVVSKDDMVYQKLCHLDNEYAQNFKDLFEEYPDVIAESFDDVRPSNVNVRQKFDLTTDQPVSRSLEDCRQLTTLLSRKEWTAC